MTLPGRIEARWLADPAVRAVMDALAAAGMGPDASRFVGGCVRNTLMGRAVDDIDIATQALPDAVMAAMERAGIRALPTGIAHGTVTAIVDHRPFEITTLRRDVETDGRRAVIAFTRDWAEDAQRRDFRMNALYADRDGTLFEPVAGGVADALAGRVVFIGNADERLREDYLRILRFFRFNAWYGAEIDAPGLAACRRQVQGLAKIAPERLWKELKKTLAARDPSPAMAAMEACGALEWTVGAGVSAAGLAGLVAAEAVLGVAVDPMRRVMAMLAQDGAACRRLAVLLRLSNEERDRLTAWAESDPGGPVAGLGTTALWAGHYRFGLQAMADRLVLEAARGGAGTHERAVLDAMSGWVRPAFPLSGRDALAAGLAGPEVGAALGALETAWIDSGFAIPREDLLRALQERARAG
jgi:poly(A) polymerase